MTELPEIKLALKTKGLNYKLQHYDSDDYLTFLDELKGTKVRGKIVRSSNEDEVFHWPLLNHVNVAPLLDVLNLRDDLKIFLTIDLQVKLKNIVHDEDFVYDSRCFDRKRAYARDIFSGLSYLHGKSLCLMNLSDKNVFICQLYDRAVISDFSSVGCSRKITRSRLKVCELYKAPETEKGEFDAMAAEIWASGTLMLDLFLAHMVPWSVIDHKSRRILEIVDKISLELLQAASAGSVVSTVDLAKFKAFLKCFFRENPSFRITARYAFIASFLRPVKDGTLRMGRMASSNSKSTKPHFILHNRSAFSSRLYSTTTKDLDKQCLPLRYLDLKQKWENLPTDSGIPRWLTPYQMTTAQNEVAFRNCFYSSISVKQSSLQKSDLCLNRLFEENGMSEEAVDEELTCTSNTRDLEHISHHRALEETRMSREEWLNHPDIQDIIENIILIQKCQNSLKSHLRQFSNEEFVSKQRRLINDYQLLLRQERIRLYEILRNQQALNAGNKSRYLGKTQSVYDTPVACGTQQKLKDLENSRPERRYSYHRAIEMAGNRKQEVAKEPLGDESQPKDKLIEKAEGKKEKESKGSRYTRRPFFFSLCPGGRVEEPVQDDVCEACKLNHKAV